MDVGPLNSWPSVKSPLNDTLHQVLPEILFGWLIDLPRNPLMRLPGVKNIVLLFSWGSNSYMMLVGYNMTMYSYCIFLTM